MKKRILFLSNHFITLFNFRRELIQKLVDQGYEVYLSMPKSEENKFFSDMGCIIIETSIERRGINPIRDLKLIFDYMRIMKKVKPDIIFSYTIKPNIYGCIASNITHYKQISNITGTGATFLNNNTVSKIVKLLYRISIKYSYKVYFQNQGDEAFFIESKMVKDNYELLPGSGVNLNQYEVSELADDSQVNFIFIGRIMKVKGIEEYLECAKIIKSKYENVNFFVAGFIEEDNYTQIIEDYNSQGIINYLGFQKDIKVWIEKCHCIVLPSYGGEGIPNVLLEAGAMGRACIASNINGVQEVIQDGINGYLFEKKDTKGLVDTIDKFLENSLNDMKEMGKKGRENVESKFDRNIIIEKYINEIEPGGNYMDEENKPIRVLHIVTQMNRNGLESRIMDIYRNIDRDKIQFDFMTNRREDGQFDDEIKQMGGNVYHMSRIAPRTFFHYLKELTAFFSQHKEYSIVHSHLNTLSTWPLRAAKKANIPIRIAHSRNASMDLNVKALYKWFSKLLINFQATDRFACSKSAGVWLFGKKQVDGNSFHVIPNAIQLDEFIYSDDERNRLREEFGMEKNEMAVVCVARFSKQKNHMFLLKVFDEIAKIEQNAKLYLVGAGELEQDIRREVEKQGLNEKVVFVGSRSDVGKVLLAMDVFIFPSYYEGFGTVIIEAQCTCLPMIASDTIPSETKLCDCVKFMSIKDEPKKWAEMAIKMYSESERKDNSHLIKERGYDIRASYEWMQKFYLDKYINIEENK